MASRPINMPGEGKERLPSARKALAGQVTMPDAADSAPPSAGSADSRGRGRRREVGRAASRCRHRGSGADSPMPVIATACGAALGVALRADIDDIGEVAAVAIVDLD